MPIHDRGNSRTRVRKAIITMLAAAPLVAASPVNPHPEEAVLRELNAGYVRAFLHSDADWYDRHLTPDFQCVLTNGSVMDRKAFLHNARKEHTTLSYDLSEVSIRIHGDAAMITALGTWKRKDGTVGRTRYVDVWVKKDGAWKAASAQLTSAPAT